jgi:hypothetical protein
MKKSITAKTFTPIYDSVEDRLRLVINYQDIQNRVDLMITRNFILDLIPSAEEFMAKHYDIGNFEQETIAETKEGATSKTDNVNLELLKTDEELLREVNFSYDPNSKHTTLRLSSKNITAITQVDGFMMGQIIQVIKSAIPYIKWGISHYF